MDTGEDGLKKQLKDIFTMEYVALQRRHAPYVEELTKQERRTSDELRLFRKKVEEFTKEHFSRQIIQSEQATERGGPYSQSYGRSKEKK
jgi:hypothetical protein